MNIVQKTGLSLLLLSCSALPAAAGLAEDGDDVSIETQRSGIVQQPFDRILDNGNTSEIFNSVVQQHSGASSTFSTGAMGGGGSGGLGAEHPIAFGGTENPQGGTMPPAPANTPAQSPNLSLTAALNTGGQTGGSAPAPELSTTSSAAPPTGISTASDTGGTPTPTAPVPLPAAGALMVSGLVAGQLVRRLRRD